MPPFAGSSKPTTSNARTPRANPRSTNSPTSCETASTQASTRCETRICPPDATSHSRSASIGAVPTGAYSHRRSNPIRPIVAWPSAIPHANDNSKPRRDHSSASSHTRSRIASASRTATEAGSSHGSGSLNTTSSPSPVSRAKVPEASYTSEPKASWYAPSTAITSSGSAPSANAAKPCNEQASTAISRRWLSSTDGSPLTSSATCGGRNDRSPRLNASISSW